MFLLYVRVVEKVTVVQNTDMKTVKSDSMPNTARVSNPIKKVGIIAKINALNGKSTVAKVNTSFTEKPAQAINYPDLIKSLNEIMAKNTSVHDYFWHVTSYLPTNSAHLLLLSES